MSEAKNQRLIDVDALLEAMPKDDVLLSCDVRKVILDAPIVDAVPLDFHNLCLEATSKIDETTISVALRRIKPKNRLLTLEEATGSNEPVWLEAMSRVFIADVCVSPDARMAQIQTIGEASCAYLPLRDYGVLWRCWLRKPTKEEMEGTPWES